MTQKGRVVRKRDKKQGLNVKHRSLQHLVCLPRWSECHLSNIYVLLHNGLTSSISSGSEGHGCCCCCCCSNIVGMAFCPLKCHCNCSDDFFVAAVLPPSFHLTLAHFSSHFPNSSSVNSSLDFLSLSLHILIWHF